MKTSNHQYQSKRMRRIIQTSIFVFIIVFCYETVNAQQYPSYSQFIMNKYVLNPAAAGMDGFTTINLIAREQWVGVKGTPKTHALSIDSRVLGDSYILNKLSIRKKKPKKTRSGNTAWGAYFYNDINGPISRTGINGSYAYHIDLGDAQLSFGMSLVMYQLKIQGDEFVLPDDVHDNLLTGSKQSFWVTDANFGAYYASESYYIGYSTISVLNSSAQFGETGQGDYKLRRQHNFISGYRFYASNRIHLEPALLAKIPEGSKAQLDVTVKGTYDDKYWAGLGVRTGTALILYGGINYDRYYFGYAFDYNLNSYMKNTYGSHEFSVIMRIGDSARRYKWLNNY